MKEPAASYTYDSEGNLISVVENDKQNSQMEYNSDNQITKSVDPKGGHYDYTYYTGTNDNPTMLHTAKTQRGAVYSYDYDDHGKYSPLLLELPSYNQSLYLIPVDLYLPSISLNYSIGYNIVLYPSLAYAFVL